MLKKLSLGSSMLLSLAVINGGVSHAVSIIDTTTDWNGLESISPFGETDTATYGQTFTVGTETTLYNFSFFLDGENDPGVVDFAGYVMEWNGSESKATGSILYQSGPLSTNANDVGFEEFQFDTGGINLTQGKQYVAFLSASDFFDGTAGTSKVGARLTDVYDGGGFFYSNNENDFSLLTTNSWDFGGENVVGFSDLAFKASFSPSVEPVPEPVTILGTFVAGALGIAFKRKSA